MQVTELKTNSKIVETQTVNFGSQVLTIEINELNDAKLHLGNNFKNRFFITVNGNLDLFSVEAASNTGDLNFVLKQKQDLKNINIETVVKRSKTYNAAVKKIDSGVKGFAISATADLNKVKAFITATYGINLN